VKRADWERRDAARRMTHVALMGREPVIPGPRWADRAVMLAILIVGLAAGWTLAKWWYRIP